jgi:hypothetical protein
MFTWYWLADVCATEDIPFVLGHALAMKAINGGKAKNDKLDSRKIAGLLRGGRSRKRLSSSCAMRQAARSAWGDREEAREREGPVDSRPQDRACGVLHAVARDRVLDGEVPRGVAAKGAGEPGV